MIHSGCEYEIESLSKLGKLDNSTKSLPVKTILKTSGENYKKQREANKDSHHE